MPVMTTRHAADTDITEEELAREYAVYDELLDRWPDHWFVIVRGELVHSPDPNALTRELRARGIGPGEVLVQRSGPTAVPRPLIRGFVRDQQPYIRAVISVPRVAGSVPVELRVDTGSP